MLNIETTVLMKANHNLEYFKYGICSTSTVGAEEIQKKLIQLILSFVLFNESHKVIYFLTTILNNKVIILFHDRIQGR